MDSLPARADQLSQLSQIPGAKRRPARRDHHERIGRHQIGHAAGTLTSSPAESRKYTRSDCHVRSRLTNSNDRPDNGWNRCVTRTRPQAPDRPDHMQSTARLNNVSERGAKAAKRHQAVSGYWHTQHTLARWCRIRSYLDSATAHGIQPSTPSAPPSQASPGSRRSPPATCSQLHKTAGDNPTPEEWAEEQLKNAPPRSEEWARKVARIYCLDIDNDSTEEKTA